MSLCQVTHSISFVTLGVLSLLIINPSHRSLLVSHITPDLSSTPSLCEPDGWRAVLSRPNLQVKALEDQLLFAEEEREEVKRRGGNSAGLLVVRPWSVWRDSCCLANQDHGTPLPVS